MSNETLQKAIETSNVGAAGGGLLNAEQTNRFLDYMWDETVLGPQVRRIRMTSNTQDIDKISVGQRLMRLATEAVDDGVNAGATFSKVSLTTKKLRLDFELSTESLEDNLEGEALEDHIVRLMSVQVGNDVEDVSINGNTALTGDPLLKSFDGWSKRARTSGHVVDNGGQPLNRASFNKALKAMPRQYLQRRNRMKFFTGSNVIQDYLYSLTDLSTTPEAIAEQMIRGGSVRTTGDAGFVTSFAFGIPVQEVPLFDEARVGTYSGTTGNHGELWLTFPDNLIWGVKREVTVYREFKPKKDTTEYTVFVRIGTAIENSDAFVIVTNVKVQA